MFLIQNYPQIVIFLKINLQIAATTGLFYFLEKIAPVEKNQLIKNYLYNVFYFMTASILLILTSPTLTNYILLIKNEYHLGFVTLPVNPNMYIQALIGLAYAIVWDFFQYWKHRLEHKFRILWHIHKFHHSDQNLNSSTQARNHIFSIWLSYFCIFLPMQFIFNNLNISAFFAFILFSFWGYFNHMNVKLDLKWLTPVISGPQLHRIHHSIEHKHYDKNFAAFFPFLDILFGTYFKPCKDEYPLTGITDENKNSLVWAYTCPLIGWHAMWKKIYKFKKPTSITM